MTDREELLKFIKWVIAEGFCSDNEGLEEDPEPDYLVDTYLKEGHND